MDLVKSFEMRLHLIELCDLINNDPPSASKNYIIALMQALRETKELNEQQAKIEQQSLINSLMEHAEIFKQRVNTP